MAINKNLTPNETNELLTILKLRFEKNLTRHSGIDWNKVQDKLEKSSEKLWSLNEMEKTGGEPDVIDYDQITEEFIFMDCSVESPIGRRSLCYDREAFDKRKEFKPQSNVIDCANKMGIELLTKEEYQQLQKLGNIDTKTSSWIKTPEEIRNLRGALFGDFRYGTVFFYHNGAESYYAARGFRGLLRV